MKNKLKFLKAELALSILLFFSCLVVFAQTASHDVNSSIGNGDAMKYNMNEPNAVNPATDNCQNYERPDWNGIETDHPEKSLSNDFNSDHYSGKK
jgi:hypothetical protein